MNRNDLREAILYELGAIAPEADFADVPDDVDLREAFDLDSMDIFNLVVALSKRLGLDIPDADAAHLVTLAGGTDYLARRLAV